MGGFSCDRVAFELHCGSISYVAITTYVANLTNHTSIDICELLCKMFRNTRNLSLQKALEDVFKVGSYQL